MEKITQKREWNAVFRFLVMLYIPLKKQSIWNVFFYVMSIFLFSVTITLLSGVYFLFSSK